MACRAKMPPRMQRTPHGEVVLTSRRMRERYYLVASGPEPALLWLFPGKHISPEVISPNTSRITFSPAPVAITVERTLRQICAKWQERWDERLDQVEGPSHTSRDDPVAAISTLGDLSEYLEPLRALRIKPATRRADQHALRLWLQELGAATPLRLLSEERLQAAFDRFLARMKPGGANRCLATLKIYLNWATNKGLTTGAPHRMVRQARVVRSHASVEWWTETEVQIALSCAREVDRGIREMACRNRKTNPGRNQARGLDREKLEGYATAELLVALGCHLGLRVEELVMQRWQDLDLNSTCPRTGAPQPVCHVVPHSSWEPKDKEPRTIPICGELHQILQRYRRENGYILEPRINRPRTSPSRRRSYRYDPRSLWRKVIARVTGSGGKRITLYGMRHTFASNLLNAGVSDVKVARWLGHADTSMVHRHYGHLLAYDDDINRRR